MTARPAVPPPSHPIPLPDLPKGFAAALVRWQRQHGRHDLPWQGTRDPYRVWLSEVMLQQTQVATVRDYYARFLTRFPDVHALAAAPADAVLAMWAGLGYYSRARHLHRCAQQVASRWGGRFPGRAAELATLPGIGRSTAAAIAAFCFGERVSILDGNVRRVLARVLAFDRDLSRPDSQRALWACADALLPRRSADMPAYTQGLMDLGATVCTTRAPRCDICPMAGVCQARAQDAAARYPVRTRRLQRQTLPLWLLWVTRADGALWMQRRPSAGIWAGLHCLPVFDSAGAALAALPAGRWPVTECPVTVHALTHRDLHLHPLRVRLTGRRPPSVEGHWVMPDALSALGLPAPVRRLLEGGGEGEFSPDQVRKRPSTRVK